MAEAAAGASLDRALKSVKGDVFSINDDGTYTISLTFNPYRFKRHVLRALFRVRQAVFNMIWPLNPVIFAGGVTGVVVKVLSSPSGSWWRSGGLAEFLWKVDNLLPWEQGLPVQARCEATHLPSPPLAFLHANAMRATNTNRADWWFNGTGWPGSRCGLPSPASSESRSCSEAFSAPCSSIRCPPHLSPDPPRPLAALPAALAIPILGLEAAVSMIHRTAPQDDCPP